MNEHGVCEHGYCWMKYFFNKGEGRGREGTGGCGSIDPPPLPPSPSFHKTPTRWSAQAQKKRRRAITLDSMHVTPFLLFNSHNIASLRFAATYIRYTSYINSNSECRLAGERGASFSRDVPALCSFELQPIIFPTHLSR